MKKVLSVLLSLMLVMSICPVLAESTATIKPGTYTGTAKGMHSTFTVEVTLDETSITNIQVVSQDDTPQMGAVASSVIPERIKEAQSVNVDVASGATISSYAVILAVKDALTQAGALELFNTAKVTATETATHPDEEADIVIVGGGGSGLSAAVAAKEQGVDKVVVLEKLSYVGGSTALSGGGCDVHSTEYNKLAGVDFTTDDFVNVFIDFAKECENRPEDMWINESLIRKVSDTVPDLFNQLVADGLPLPENFWDVAIVTHDLEGDGHGIIAFGPTFPSAMSSGPMYSIWFGQYAADKGADIRLNSEVAQLLVEDGAVTGVVVESDEGSYTIHAKKVILACGGIENNSELVAQYVPEIAGAQVLACPGNTGDFVALTEGLDTVITGYGCVPQAGLNLVYEANTTYGQVSLFGVPLWVNVNGERFVDEIAHYSVRSLAVSQQEKSYAWGIADSNNANVATIEQELAEGGLPVYKADTLEELADLIKVPVEALTSTVEKYNADYAVGTGDSVFGLAQDAMAPVLQAPFYAQKVTPLNMFCMVSLKVDDTCHVLNSDGNVIPNLYGVGEVAVGNLFFETYACSGSAVEIALCTGKIAALDAAATLD